MGRSFSGIVLIPLLLSMVMAGASSEEGTHSSRGLRVLLMGVVDRSINPLSDWLSAEPGTFFSVVPSRLYMGSWEDTHGEAFQDEIRRFIRIYFPRSLDDLEAYEVVLFSSIVVTMYSHTQIDWLVGAIREGGACAIADTGGMMGKSTLMYLPWAESSVSEAFPCDADATASLFGYGDAPNLGEFRVRLNRDLPDPVFTPFLAFGIEGWRGSSGRIMLPQTGSVIWGWMHLEREVHPWVLSWRYGSGITWSIGDAPRYPFWSRYEVGWSDNDFGMDMWFNMMYYGTGRRLVTDVSLVHAARDSFRLFRLQIETVTGFMDFVERFGANAQPLLEEVAGLEPVVKQAEQEYIAQEYASSLDAMAQAMQSLMRISEQGAKLRREALMWVYLTEWTVITSVALISGLALYSLMFKRSLYREAGATRYGV